MLKHLGKRHQRRVKELYTDIDTLRELERASSKKVKPAFRTLIRLCYRAIEDIIGTAS